MNKKDMWIVLRNNQVELYFDKSCGGALRQTIELQSGIKYFSEGEHHKRPDIVLVCNDEEIRLSTMELVSSHLFKSEDGGLTELVMVSRSKEMEIKQVWRLMDNSNWAKVTLTIKNLKNEDVLIDRYPKDWQQENPGAVAGDLYHYTINPGGVDLNFAGISVGNWKTLKVVTPEMGYPFFHNRWNFASMNDFSISVTSSPHGLRMPYAMAFNPEAAEGRGGGILFTWVDKTCLTYFRFLADNSSQTGQINLQLWYARYLRPFESVTLQPIYIVPFTGHYRPMMREYRSWLIKEHGVAAPKEKWKLLGKMFIVGNNAFGLRENMSFDDIRPYVDRAAQMNARGFWISGAWEDTRYNNNVRVCQNNCCIMPVDDVYTPKAIHGGEKSLKSLIEYIHSKGMKAICWITGGGLPWPSNPVQKYSDWWSYMKYPIPNEKIKNPAWPGTLPGNDRPNEYLFFPFPELCAPDTTSHGWREFWKRSFLKASNLGFDGVFIDSMNPMMPNYRRYPWPGETSMGVIPLHRETRELVKMECFTSLKQGVIYVRRLQML